MRAMQVMVLMMVCCSALSRASLATGLANMKWPPSSSLSRLLRLRGAGNSRGSAAPTVTVYMHGEPETPASDEARDLVGILRKHNIEFAAYDIGADALLRQDVSRSSNWKTFPQLHVNGRLLGDLGIVKELEQDDLLLSEIALFRSMPSLDTDAHTNSETQQDLRAAWSTAVQQDNDLIDEQDIVPDLDLKASPKQQECGPDNSNNSPKKKACKNCSCGLAEQQAALAREQGAQGRELGAPDSHADTPTHTPLNTDNSKSACGSCYLGDAYRCESCPYKGLPPFKPGEKVALASVCDL